MRRTTACWATCATFFVLSAPLLAQTDSAGSDKPSPGAAAPVAAPPLSSAEASTTSWRTVVPNILQDQKRIWLYPTQVAQGKHLKPILAFVGVTVAMVALDPHDTPPFRRTSHFEDFNRALSSRKTTIGSSVFPLAWYAVGLARKDSYAQQTALLAGEAVASVQIVTTVMKNVDRRLRPYDIPPDGNFSDTWFKAHGRILSGRGSFPSGHTMGAFAVATVFAERYGRGRRWVPWVAYGLAGIVGFSRISTRSHFPSDVVAGAILSSAITHFVVLRRPR